jgi:hypothetical protein
MNLKVKYVLFCGMEAWLENTSSSYCRRFSIGVVVCILYPRLWQNVMAMADTTVEC